MNRVALRSAFSAVGLAGKVSARMVMAGLVTVGVVMAGVVIAGCSRTDSADATATTLGAVLQAPVTESDFCDLMLATQSDTRADDDPISQDELLARYRDALAVAPDAVRDDLQQVVDQMSSPAATTVPGFVDGGTDDVGEGWSPAATPGGRVIDYVDTHCAGTTANPGPAATPPGS